MTSQEQTIEVSKFFNPDQILKDIGIEEGMIIADFGAGNGYMTFSAVLLVGSKGTVYALDVKKSVISHIRAEIKARSISNIKLIWTNLEIFGANPIQDNSVDVVLIVNTLFQSRKHKQMLMEAKRVAKPGGLIAIVDWKKESAPFGPPVDERVSIEKIKQISYDMELNKIKEFSAGKYHFGMVFKK
ncbi:MAG: hypothetical protein A3H61_03785 [Candidatus Jacksonbacteria bacterium RIFCSPLOWO2_02_FULL_44_20]|uniref:Methyltransferase domain-containing protein n=1 Tax=Candidatus Jacksonbacteria bacterium RIFCSPLOWO2_02_FULL_44_20 TaxID=1798460 RepID=A0A1G2A6D7_9BACT|nr:MAG: hypothetical protein A3H61_03785 [Candidatus Jacksonbacteria bacterium RIFCSPLOWO2_02_FULL_44_20]